VEKKKWRRCGKKSGKKSREDVEKKRKKRVEKVEKKDGEDVEKKVEKTWQKKREKWWAKKMACDVLTFFPYVRLNLGKTKPAHTWRPKSKNIIRKKSGNSTKKKTLDKNLWTTIRSIQTKNPKNTV